MEKYSPGQTAVMDHVKEYADAIQTMIVALPESRQRAFAEKALAETVTLIGKAVRVEPAKVEEAPVQLPEEPSVRATKPKKAKK